MAKSLGIYSDFSEPLKKDIDEYISGGYVRKDKFTYNPKPIKETSLIANQKQLIAFDEMIQLLNSKNIQLVLIYAPITKTYYTKVGYNLNFDSVFRETKLPYFNFNEYLQIEDSAYFYDGHHLNPNGVEIFNKAILDSLTSNKLLPIH